MTGQGAALLCGFLLGLAFGMFAIAGFLNDDTVQWRLGPIWYRRVGVMTLLEVGRLKFGKIAPLPWHRLDKLEDLIEP